MRSDHGFFLLAQFISYFLDYVERHHRISECLRAEWANKTFQALKPSKALPMFGCRYSPLKRQVPAGYFLVNWILTRPYNRIHLTQLHDLRLCLSSLLFHLTKHAHKKMSLRYWIDLSKPVEIRDMDWLFSFFFSKSSGHECMSLTAEQSILEYESAHHQPT